MNMINLSSRMILKIFCAFYSFCLFIPSANAQNLKPFSISGDVSNVKEPIKRVLIFYKVGQRKYVEDSCEVKNGKYLLKGNIPDGRPAYLTAVPFKNDPATKSNYAIVYIEPAEMWATSDIIFSDMTLTGSKGQTDYDAWQKAQPFTDTLNSLFRLGGRSMKNLSDKDREADSLSSLKYRALFKLFEQKQADFNLQYAREHLNSPVIMEIIASAANETEQEKLFILTPEDLQKTQLGEELAANFAVKPGKQGADFTLPDTSGHNITLSSLRGKYVLLDFWASWCAPCRRENPFLVKAFNKYKNNFTILSVSFDYANNRQAWLDAITKDGIGMWTHVSSLSGFNSEPGRLYGRIDGIPANFLLDRCGKIIAKNIKGAELDKKLEELIQ